MKTIFQPIFKSAVKHDLVRSILSIFPQSNTSELLYKESLKKIGAGVNEYIRVNSIKPKIKVLWSPGFNVNPYYWIHDGILASALRIRGCEILPLMCGGLPLTECVVMEGVWGTGNTIDDKENINMKNNIFKTQCQKCVRSDYVMWRDIWHIRPVNLANNMNNNQLNKIFSKINSLKPNQWHNFVYDGMSVGKWAFDTAINSYQLGYISDPEKFFSAAKNYIIHTLFLNYQYKKFLDLYNPDRIICHNTFYYMWKILGIESKKRHINYYTYSMGGLQGSWVYQMNEPASEVNISSTWKTWKNHILTEGQNKKLDNYIFQRKRGDTIILDTTKPLKSEKNVDSENYLIRQLDKRKPVFLLATNICWEASARNKDVQFKNMIEGTIETVRYFIRHPEYQLIVKAHPGEIYPGLPVSTHQVIKEIRKVFPSLPSNIILLEPHVQVSIYDLISLVSVLIVYTSTTGIEYAIKGVPVITFGKSCYTDKGFTYDSNSRKEYFSLIPKVLIEGKRDSITKERIRLSRLFFYFYYFIYQTRSGMYTYNYDGYPKVFIKSYEDILPGKNQYLDYLCDSIINNQPLYSETRWLPESS